MNEMNLMNNEEQMMEQPMVEMVIEPEMIQEEQQEERGNVLPIVLGAAAIGAGVILYKKVVEPKLIDMATNYLAKKKAQMEERAGSTEENPDVVEVDFNSEVE